MIDIIIALVVGFFGGMIFGIFFIAVLAMAGDVMADVNKKEEEECDSGTTKQ